MNYEQGGKIAVSAGECAGWDVFFYRQSGRTKKDFAGGSHWQLARGDAEREKGAPISYRRDGDSAGSFACAVDIARR